MDLSYKHTNARMSQIVIAGKTVYLAGQLSEANCAPVLEMQAEYGKLGWLKDTPPRAYVLNHG